VGYRSAGSPKDPLFHKPTCHRRRLQVGRGTLRTVGERRRCGGGESRLFHNGERTSERLLGSWSRARPVVVEDPGGPGRLRGASSKAARKPMGGWPPYRGGAAVGQKTSRREKPRRGADSGVGRTAGWRFRTPGTRSPEDGLAGCADRFRVPHSAERCTAGGQPTSRGRRASREVPTDPEERTPEGRSPGALRHEIGPGGLAGRKPARGSKP